MCDFILCTCVLVPRERHGMGSGGGTPAGCPTTHTVPPHLRARRHRPCVRPLWHATVCTYHIKSARVPCSLCAHYVWQSQCVELRWCKARVLLQHQQGLMRWLARCHDAGVLGTVCSIPPRVWCAHTMGHPPCPVRPFRLRVRGLGCGLQGLVCGCTLVARWSHATLRVSRLNPNPYP